MNPAGRAILKTCRYVPEPEAPTEEFPLQLSTGRRTRHFNMGTKTGHTPESQDADPESYIQIAEDDAKDLGVKEGDRDIAESW